MYKSYTKKLKTVGDCPPEADGLGADAGEASPEGTATAGEDSEAGQSSPEAGGEGSPEGAASADGAAEPVDDSPEGTAWIEDTGASTHMGNTCEAMYDVKEINEPIVVGNGNKARVYKLGTLPVVAAQVNGESVACNLKDYKYSLDLNVCLFSITKALEKGWKISNEGLTMVLTKGDLSLRFDRRTKTRNGILCGINLLPNTRLDSGLTGNDGVKGHCDINVFHKIYGHASVSQS